VCSEELPVLSGCKSEKTIHGEGQQVRKRNSAFALMLALLVIFPAGAAETKAGLPIPQIYYPPSSPRLLAASLRYENITDNEVRQIQAAMPARWRGNIVNI
jgi:hypothetical protein